MAANPKAEAGEADDSDIVSASAAPALDKYKCFDAEWFGFL